MIRCALSGEPFWCLWGLLPVWAQWGVVLCVLLMIGGVAWRLVAVAKAFGGWPTALGALGLIGILAAIIWPKRHSADDVFPHPDNEPVHPRARKGRPTVLREPGEEIKNWFDRITKAK